MTEIQLEIPETTGLRGHCNLLAPLRAKIDIAQAAARAALHDIDPEAQCSMLWDECEDAIALLDLAALELSYRDVRAAWCDAAQGRHGYDTWERPALHRHLRELREVQDALETLIGAMRHLAASERMDLAELRGLPSVVCLQSSVIPS